MAFIIEDGTGKVDANSYLNVQGFKDHHTDRGNDFATLYPSDPDIEKALVRATDYIEVRFSQSFKGQKEFPDTPQRLSFPRVNLVDREGEKVEGIPTRLEEATAEYAFRATLTTPLMPDPVIDETGRSLTRNMRKVGPIEEAKSFTAGSDVRTIKPFPAADRLLAEYVGAGQGVIRG